MEGVWPNGSIAHPLCGTTSANRRTHSVCQRENEIAFRRYVRFFMVLHSHQPKLVIERVNQQLIAELVIQGILGIPGRLWASQLCPSIIWSIMAK